MLKPWLWHKRVDSSSAMDSEQIMEKLLSYYSVEQVGLIATAESLGVPLKCPRQNATVLMAGAHNLAKEKMLDLYYNEKVSGRELEYADLDLHKIRVRQGPREKCVTRSHLPELKAMPGLNDKLTMEVAPAHTNDLVSFIFTPEYEADDANSKSIDPLNLDSTVTCLIHMADSVFIFFDPSGTIPASQILEPYENLWEKCSHKFHLVLAKASDDECELKRNTVLAELMQALQKIPYFRQEGVIRIPEIHMPDLTKREWKGEPVIDIVKPLENLTVRRGLEKLETDSNMLIDLLKTKREPQQISLIIMVIGIVLLTCGLDPLVSKNGPYPSSLGRIIVVVLTGFLTVILVCWDEAVNQLNIFRAVPSDGKSLSKGKIPLMLQLRDRFIKQALEQKKRLMKKFEAKMES